MKNSTRYTRWPEDLPTQDLPDFQNLPDVLISAPRIFLPLKTTKEHVSLDFFAHSRTGKLGEKVSSKVFLNELKWFKFMVGLICVHDIDCLDLPDFQNLAGLTSSIY